MEDFQTGPAQMGISFSGQLSRSLKAAQPKSNFLSKSSGRIEEGKEYCSHLTKIGLTQQRLFK
jgi:hypothetical protein